MSTAAALLALLMNATTGQTACVGHGAAQECAVKTRTDIVYLSCVRTSPTQQVCSKH